MGGGLRPSGYRHLVGDERAAGIAWARRWRAMNKPYFDELYGPEPGDLALCAACQAAIGDDLHEPAAGGSAPLGLPAGAGGANGACSPAGRSPRRDGAT